jgi:hypothetical protein
MKRCKGGMVMEPVSAIVLSGIFGITAKFLVQAFTKLLKEPDVRTLEVKLPSGETLTIDVPSSMSQEEADRKVQAVITEAAGQAQRQTSAE